VESNINHKIFPNYMAKQNFGSYTLGGIMVGLIASLAINYGFHLGNTDIIMNEGVIKWKGL